MRRSSRRSTNISGDDRRILLLTAAVLIPCFLGVIGMVRDGVPAGIWIQNPLFIAVFAFLSLAAVKLHVRIPAVAVVAASMLLLLLTLLGPGMEGVHRWLRLPVFSLNIAAVVLPVSIAAFVQLLREKQIVFASVGIAGIALMLCLQPDASQLLAFSVSMIIVLIVMDMPKIWKGCICGLLLLLTILSWFRPDPLSPVSYTEGILLILRGQSVILFVLGIIALLCLPGCLLTEGFRKRRLTETGIGMYYLLTILSSFTGRFPVPFMGYGVSAILGLYLFLAFGKDW